MAVFSYPNGLASTGPKLVTQSPAVGTGTQYWVDSVNGDDTNAGTLRSAPKASIFGASGALASVSDSVGDVVWVEKDHTETVSSAYTWSHIGVTMVGLGTSGDRPTLTSDVAGVFITISGANNRIHNFDLPASTAATTAKISITTGHNTHLNNLLFTLGTLDQTDQLLISGADYCLIENCQFTVGAAAAAGTTQCGITMTGAAIGNAFRDLTFDDATYGWTQTAFEIDDATADDWLVERLRLKNNSWFKVTASGSNGMISGITVDDNSGWSIVD